MPIACDSTASSAGGFQVVEGWRLASNLADAPLRRNPREPSLCGPFAGPGALQRGPDGPKLALAGGFGVSTGHDAIFDGSFKPARIAMRDP